MSILKNLTYITLLFSFLLVIPSCASKSYPCPGNGTMKSADLSLFDEDGNPKSDRNKKKKGNGLVGKKEPKRIHQKKK